MTGPRTTTVHPHRRRGRRLLPFLLVMTLGPLACTSDQPTEPMSSGHEPVAAATGAHPRPLLKGARLVDLLASSSRMTRSGAVFSLGAAGTVSGTGASLLILADADDSSTAVLKDTLSDAGFQVTVRPAPEYTWDGTNPALAGFDVVIHLNGAGYDGTFNDAAQQALSDFVANGGGYIGAEWNGVEFTPLMPDLILQTAGGGGDAAAQNCAVCEISYQAVSGQAGHPVLAGLSGGFTFIADAHDAGPQVAFETNPSTVLMQLPTGAPGVLVRQFGSGKVVNFSFAPNYPIDNSGELRDPTTLQDSNIKRLYINAARWVSGSAAGSAQPQTITFDVLANKVYGQPPFSINAVASSGLPVSFTASGDCTVLGNTVTIIHAGACTITAHQAGNDNYEPAEDVSQSFSITKAPATITVGTEYTYDGTVKSATVTISPAGLSGLSVSYSLNGSPAAQPINAGVYQVVVTLDNPNYQAPATNGTLTIVPRMPDLHWSPAPLSTGTPLGPSQLNASATGLGGTSLSGSFTYTPPAGTAFDAAGTVSLSVQFAPGDPNYSSATKAVSIAVSGAMSFTGFYAPVRNMPYLNAVTAGSAIPIKFAVGGYRGLRVLQLNSPTSVPVACPANALQNTVRPLIAPSSGLKSLGSSYTYVWKTNAGWGGTCRKFVLTLVDGSTHEAMFRFVIAPKANAAKRILGGK
jgi:hypothetical protein